MTLAADTSFMVSLYGIDLNAPEARDWMVRTAEPILVPKRFETENALRLACFRERITAGELMELRRTWNPTFRPASSSFATSLRHDIGPSVRGSAGRTR